jgi:hypothetical protein
LVSAIKFGSAQNEQYTLDNYYPAIFDTGTSFILVPKAIAKDLIGKILKG